MNVRIIAAAALAAACLPVFAETSANSDSVSASFARMLEHRPHAGQTGVGNSVDERDPLEALVYAALRGEHPAPAVAADPYAVQIAASFERMLADQPYTGPLMLGYLPGGIDPLEAAIRTLLLEPGKAMLAGWR
ncbi:MAG: hypothetical protein IT532_15380 [Burkholderiales bacterium]|nr:hypothetical protein [Burkholderiales bacterium]